MGENGEVIRSKLRMIDHERQAGKPAFNGSANESGVDSILATWPGLVQQP
jgi:hypothetical protein